jgi:hypothetical protein
MMGILFENSKKEYPKSFTEVLRLEEKRFVEGICYFISKIPKLKSDWGTLVSRINVENAVAGS